MSVLLETSYGDIVIDLLTEHAPVACRNFLKLCAIKYYNDCEFFRVEKGFIAQTGDPSNTGNEGESVHPRCVPPGASFFEPEITPAITHASKGTVSMAASSANQVNGKKGHGSQFFITLADGLDYLDAEHTIFGQVAEGMAVVDKIAEAYVDDKFRPFRLIRIRHTIILHDPFDDPIGLPQNCASPEPAQGGRGDRLGSDEEEEEEQTEEQKEEQERKLKQAEEEREAKSRAEVLEMIGDIADADLKPPENVLFICKLNPVTEAEDLEIIFSRFGECQADILRDRATGESLCYGFIEFENKAQCERAYFKMDNALIDDRRVRVDFSQSVRKLWNNMRRQKAAAIRAKAKQLNASKRKRSDEGPNSHSTAKVTPDVQGGQAPGSEAGALRFNHSPRKIARRRKRSRFDVAPPGPVV